MNLHTTPPPLPPVRHDYPGHLPLPEAPGRMVTQKRILLSAGVVLTLVAITFICAVIAFRQGVNTASTHHGAPPAASAPPTPTAPAPPPLLPTAEANRKTCESWKDAESLVVKAHDASLALEGHKILDAEVRDNPKMAAAVATMVDYFTQAGQTLHHGIAPGTTPKLALAATTASFAIITVAAEYRDRDETNGDGVETWRKAKYNVNSLCSRLVR